MKIAILGCGFTGLVAALRLSQNGHQVVIFEKERVAGGLASGFDEKDWRWSLEKGYHHWFTNDDSILNLAKELKVKKIVKRPKTDVYINQRFYPLDSAKSVLSFSKLPFIDRVRLGLGVFYMKLVKNPKDFEKKRTVPWIRKIMGKKVASLIWEPLLFGKFGKYYNQISLSWFWARIKKRTEFLVYPEGGFKKIIDRIIEETKINGGNVMFNSTVKSIKTLNNQCFVNVHGINYKFDKVLVTLPTPIFIKIAKGLTKSYLNRISSIKHLSAHILILVLKKSFMNNTYWLNILEKEFPFLVIVEHTNFMDPKEYGGKHILYIGNYLHDNHYLMTKSANELLKIYDPFLKLLNPHYKTNLIKTILFKAPFAQPVVTTNYKNKIPHFKTPLKNVYLANMDMVFPWDRGTNYAVEMGETVTNILK